MRQPHLLSNTKRRIISARSPGQNSSTSPHWNQTWTSFRTVWHLCLAQNSPCVTETSFTSFLLRYAYVFYKKYTDLVNIKHPRFYLLCVLLQINDSAIFKSTFQLWAKEKTDMRNFTTVRAVCNSLLYR